jgi:hypothetical protein
MRLYIQKKKTEKGKAQGKLTARKSFRKNPYGWTQRLPAISSIHYLASTMPRYIRLSTMSRFASLEKFTTSPSNTWSGTLTLLMDHYLRSLMLNSQKIVKTHNSQKSSGTQYRSPGPTVLILQNRTPGRQNRGIRR